MLREELLTRKEVALLAKVSIRTLSRWCETGKFPRPIRVPDANGRLRWVGSEVSMWLARHRITGESVPVKVEEPAPKKARSKKPAVTKQDTPGHFGTSAQVEANRN